MPQKTVTLSKPARKLLVQMLQQAVVSLPDTKQTKPQKDALQSLLTQAEGKDATLSVSPDQDKIVRLLMDQVKGTLERQKLIKMNFFRRFIFKMQSKIYEEMFGQFPPLSQAQLQRQQTAQGPKMNPLQAMQASRVRARPVPPTSTKRKAK